ncbi:Carbamoyl-phosphate synthase large chain [Seminavis robusta]|uniref:Carbamoyl-phosphate synthase large chain n=1 Tax=Seminavis robusta TaxID=568900 RepID=A0A9N8F187_9STRA|nr:Carbamoyl-phosphate synthase large chain [Seminavis robusta]|eukprot:Sro2246_g320570.1 Carbamoyl-phosphate synthase large chain (1540) ;mRNA; f:5042-10133
MMNGGQIGAGDSLDFQGDPALLYLADGSPPIEARSFGAPTSISGEVVFNTGMVGYPEALSDPSYRGQILVLTYPLIGNYGVPDETIRDDYDLPKFFESNNIHIAGLVVSSYSWQHSHWSAQKSLSKWLYDNNIPGIYGVDTRALTKKLREYGSILGKLLVESFEDPNMRNLVAEVSTKKVQIYGKGNSPRIVAYDCGMKFNIIRYLVNVHNVELMVVPFDYDLEANADEAGDWKGLFLSNGPGDPTMCAATIKSIQYALALEPPRPIFGICLGNQLLALAAGAKTYKLKYGNRGMNQPCIDLRTGRCYITPQNHGFAVDSDSLPTDCWKALFLNANDLTNEGIVHTSKPFFSVQFHPEASGGPVDTAFLFEKFVGHVRNIPQPLVLHDGLSYARKTYKKVLLVGSGGLSIGQAGEFDYSGSQCIKALKEEGIEVILINPNIATVQTSQEQEDSVARSADRVYFLPIQPNVVMDIIHKEKPDGIIVSMGGQTALNVGVELWRDGLLQAAGVEVLGTQIPVIEATEDREIFSAKLKEIGETIALSYSATTVEEAKEVANKIGYPVLIRAAYALGGLGSGFAADDEELKEMAAKAFTTSSQILIDQDLRGWKELEYEVVRDSSDNCITVCNMENFDPLGIHTGDSIVVAPSQTLTNREYFMLRTTALKVVRHLGIVGECNIQYALHPESERYCIIEVNARLSRSSALASKATGYPLAYVATKISLGKDLVSIRNSVTKTTTACFEPSLDYCVVKMPRWDLKKFKRVSNKLGSSMLSVGEVMAIGRSFEETIQKACRMVNPVLSGLDGQDSNLIDDSDDLETQLKTPTDTRLFAVQTAFEIGWSIDKVHELTKIDRWFLSKLRNIAMLRQACKDKKSLEDLVSTNGYERMRTLKMAGFSDKQIARYVGLSPGLDGEQRVRDKRKALRVIPVVKQIDTLAAEFPAQTNYLYLTYSGDQDDVEGGDGDLTQSTRYSVMEQNREGVSPGDFKRRARGLSTSGAMETLKTKKERGVIVLGCGAYCIGSSVEFDWCAVSCIRQLRRDGFKSIIINYNPETVSTDYDESDRLYFEELSLERVLDIYERENPYGLVVSVGGQIPNNLSGPLAECGVKILGTSARDIERAEDRQQFSDMVDSMGIKQPAWSVLSNKEDAVKFANTVGFPVLVRPSFVLSGAAMRVAADETQLTNFLDIAADVAADKPVVVTKFIVNAKEIEFDAIANNGNILNYAIGEHLENAGVHSGDATVILPAQKLYVKTIRQVKTYASWIAKALRITGPFNIQFMAKGNNVEVIECNLRASRTIPFVSKTLNHNFISLATRAMTGMDVQAYKISLLDIEYVCVKAPIFSFTRLRGADPTLGVEMASTGEVACFGVDSHQAFLQAMLSTSFKLPNKNRSILLSIASDKFRAEFSEAAEILFKLGYKLYATPGTANYYKEHHGMELTVVNKPTSETDDGEGTALYVIKQGAIDLAINVSEGTTRKDEITSGYIIRRGVVDFGVSLITDVKCAIKFAECMERGWGDGKFEPLNVGEFYKLPMIGWAKGQV